MMRINIGGIVTDETLAETEARLVEEAISVVAERDAPDVARHHNGRSHLSQVEAMFLAHEVEKLRERLGSIEDDAWEKRSHER